MDSQRTQTLLLQATATENWAQFIRTATIRSGCPATWTAYPSRALNVTWTPFSMRPSWMVDLWTLISTPRLPLMGFLRGWRPLHTAGCPARDNIRWEWCLLWRDSHLKCQQFVWLMSILYSHTQGFSLLINVNLTGNWRVKEMERWSLCKCHVTHLKQQSNVCQYTVWRTQTHKNILVLSVCPKAGIKNRL